MINVNMPTIIGIIALFISIKNSFSVELSIMKVYSLRARSRNSLFSNILKF